MAINYVTLKNEILTDPTARGYAPLVAVGDDAGVATLMNLVILGNTIFRNDVRSEEIWEAIAASEFNALTSIALQRLTLIMAQASNRGAMDVSRPNLRSMLGGVFAAGSTRTALLALAQRDGSRAETLFGAGTGISHQDVAQALRGTP